MFKQLKEKLNSLEETLKSEHERLTTVLEGIEIVENNKHILDDEDKRIHLNTIEIYHEQVYLYNIIVVLQFKTFLIEIKVLEELHNSSFFFAYITLLIMKQK